MFWRTFIFIMLIGPAIANAGFLDNVLNTAKDVAGDTVKQAIEGTTVKDNKEDDTVTTESPDVAPVKPSKPIMKNHKQLVFQIQHRLNELGYGAGKPDGLYGPGTRKAIEAFEKNQGLPIKGQPTRDLLTELEKDEPKKDQITQASSKSTQGDNSASNREYQDGHPSQETMAYILAYYVPEILEKEVWLKHLVGNIDPMRWNWLNTDEFKWQKEKGNYKADILAKSKRVQTNFKPAPWIDGKEFMSPTNYDVAATLGKYDFNQKAFEVTVKLRIRLDPISGGGMFLTVGGVDPKTIQWLPMEPDRAEQLVNQMGPYDRTLYGSYIYQIADIDYAGWESYNPRALKATVVIDKIDLFRYQGKKGTLKNNFVFVAALSPSPSDTASIPQKTSTEKPKYEAPAEVSLLEGAALKKVLIGNTVEGNTWAAYFSEEGTVETLWQHEPGKESFSINGPLICFPKESKIATADCIAVSQDKLGNLQFYELYGDKKLIPYRTAPGPFPGLSQLHIGRIEGLLDPEGYIKAADADVVGIKLGMSLDEVDQIIKKHRDDMLKIQFDGHKEYKNTMPWDSGWVHIRYESPDKKEVIGVQVEPPTAENQVTLVWRSLSYDIKTGAPERDTIVKALYEKYGGKIPGKPKYPSGEVFNWANNGGGLISDTGCSARPNSLPAPLSNPGPLNYIDARCGETVTAELRVREGYVQHLTIYLVNQARLAQIVKTNETAHVKKTEISNPTL